MRIALTGVSGFIGSVASRHLAEAGHQVTGLVRSKSRRDHIEPFVDRFVVGDQADVRVWPDLLEGADCVVHNSVDWAPLRKPLDVQVHLQSNLVGAIELLHAAMPRRFVFLSSIGVHHYMRPRWEGHVDEDHPLRPGGLYGAAKAAMEDHLWAAHATHDQHFCAIRPCGVYGQDPNLERTIGFPIVEQISRGEPFRRLGGGKFVHVDDVAGSIVAAVEDDADARVVNLVDCYARWADWALMVSELLGVEADIDDTSLDRPKNLFCKKGAGALGLKLDRGHEGIRTHLAKLIERMDL
jgi:nucleoside-diphosphate-sugar epimerase